MSRIVLIVALSGVTRCGPASSPAPSIPRPSAADVAGAWTGTSRVTNCDMLSGSARCNAVNNIALLISQNGAQLTGKYTCAIGNMICRHGGADDSGRIESGSISGNRLNLSVMIPADLSNCYFSGSTTSPTQANGVYMCYQGGLQVEEGEWNVSRAAAD
ncbi:MAG TPA: hypothetical protein VN754_14055 [Candidatus Binataceae bacterium]|nr:hypothetical protein [Candidatus Binataceae bacterium]